MTTPPLTNPLLDPAHLQMLAQQSQQSAPPIIRPPSTDTPPPAVGSLGMPSAPPSLTPPPSPTVTRIPTQLDNEKTEQARKVNTGSGISQIASKVEGTNFGQAHPLVGKLLGGAAQGLATLGDVGLRAVAPAVDIALPGTSLHHIADLNQGQRQIAADEENAEKEAQTKNLDLQPQLKLGQQALAQERQSNTEQHQKDVLAQTVQHQNDTEAATLAQHGYAKNEDGTLRPLRYQEMSESQQAVHDLNGARQEQAAATAELKKAQNDPNSSAFKLAQQRVNNAAHTASIAEQRLGLSQNQFEMRAYGTEGGVPLPGSMLTEDNRPVGTAFQQNVRPTGQERNKTDMANSAAQQIGDMKSIIAKRPDIFGPAAGRKTDFTVWLGSQDPDAQRFRAARTIAGDHLAGTFGGRSEAALHALDNALGQFKDNPKAAMAGLDQLSGANTVFQKAGTVRTTGGQPAAPTRPSGVPANAVWDQNRNNGKGSWRIP